MRYHKNQTMWHIWSMYSLFKSCFGFSSGCLFLVLSSIWVIYIPNSIISPSWIKFYFGRVSSPKKHRPDLWCDRFLRHPPVPEKFTGRIWKGELQPWTLPFQHTKYPCFLVDSFSLKYSPAYQGAENTCKLFRHDSQHAVGSPQQSDPPRSQPLSFVENTTGDEVMAGRCKNGPLKTKQWLAGKLPVFSFGNTSTHSWWIFICQVSFGEG